MTRASTAAATAAAAAAAENAPTRSARSTRPSSPASSTASPSLPPHTMTSSPLDAPTHTIDRTPEYEDFMNRLRDYHTKRGTTLDPEPRVGMMHIDLLKVFNHIVANGGYDRVSEEKLAWRRMASELGIHTTNEASTAFALKEKFYKNLAAFEIATVHGKEPPPKDILEDVTAKGASLLTRTRENFRGRRERDRERETTANPTDSPASGDDGTPTRERPAPELPTSSSRASRGLREAPPQRVIFQPEASTPRPARQASQQQQQQKSQQAQQQQQQPQQPQQQQQQQQPAQAAPTAPAVQPPALQHHPQPPAQAMMHQAVPQSHAQHTAVNRGPSIVHHPPNADNTSQLVLSYQPKYMRPLTLRPGPTPFNAPHEFPKVRPQQRLPPGKAGTRRPMLPGTGFDGPNIYTRCLNSLRSRVPAEQAFALNHLVKISFERGDKYRFDAFPGLAEGLVDKALQIGNLFHEVSWRVSWDAPAADGDIGCLDGNYGTPNILERIQSLVEKDVPDALQTASYADELILISEAVLTIRNMVTLAENAINMSDFCPVKDLVCIILHLPPHDMLVELKHLALDIAEQMTPYMVLDATDPLYKTLLGQLASEDRGTILTALRALGRISMKLDATNRLADMPPEALRRLANWLLLNDDELVDACLDLLYQYTAVVPNLDHLLQSTSPEELVDNLVRLLSHGARRTQRELVLLPEQRLPARNEIAPVPEDLLQELMKLEEPERVHRWVRCFFDEDDHSFITQLAAWQAYQSAFSGPLKDVGKAMITPADFIRNSTSVYKNSNAQVLREPGETQQKFIIHGIRARARPLSMDGTEYGRCLWAPNAEKKNEKCGQFYLKPEQMGEHILIAHLDETRNAAGQFDNVEREFRCTWGECFKYEKPTKLRLRDFARHINTHILALLPGQEAASKRTSPSGKAWVMPAKTLALAAEETLTTRDERNPNAPPQAAGIPLSAVLVLRNMARNVVKTEAEKELVKQQRRAAGEGGREEVIGWNEKLFRPMMPRLFEILAENKALSPYIASLLDLARAKVPDDDDDDDDDEGYFGYA